MNYLGKYRRAQTYSYYHPSPCPRPHWDDSVFDTMNYLVKKYGPCKISYASRDKGIVAVFKGKYKVSINDDGVTEWLTEEPPGA